MSKVLKEFGTALSVNYPKAVYPQDLIDSQVLPALRRSYDRARRENLLLAQKATSKFDLKVGPVIALMKHVLNGELMHCDIQWDDQATCELCDQDTPLVIDEYMHQFGWYVAIELEEDDDAISKGQGAPYKPLPGSIRDRC